MRTGRPAGHGDLGDLRDHSDGNGPGSHRLYTGGIDETQVPRAAAHHLRRRPALTREHLYSAARYKPARAPGSPPVPGPTSPRAPRRRNGRQHLHFLVGAPGRVRVRPRGGAHVPRRRHPRRRVVRPVPQRVLQDVHQPAADEAQKGLADGLPQRHDALRDAVLRRDAQVGPADVHRLPELPRRQRDDGPRAHGAAGLLQFGLRGAQHRHRQRRLRRAQLHVRRPAHLPHVPHLEPQLGRAHLPDDDLPRADGAVHRHRVEQLARRVQLPRAQVARVRDVVGRALHVPQHHPLRAHLRAHLLHAAAPRRRVRRAHREELHVRRRDRHRVRRALLVRVAALPLVLRAQADEHLHQFHQHTPPAAHHGHGDGADADPAARRAQQGVHARDCDGRRVRRRLERPARAHARRPREPRLRPRRQKGRRVSAGLV